MNNVRILKSLMKGITLVLVIMIMAVVVSGTGCDSDSDSDSGSPIVRVYPWNGLAGVDPDTEIIVQFNTSLNTGVLGTVAFQTRAFDDTYATITFGTTSLTNDTVFVKPDLPLGDASTYEPLYVYGFEDSEGNTIATVNDFDYSCTTR